MGKNINKLFAAEMTVCLLCNFGVKAGCGIELGFITKKRKAKY